MTASISRPVTSSSTTVPVPTPVAAPIQREEAKGESSTTTTSIKRLISPCYIGQKFLEVNAPGISETRKVKALFIESLDSETVTIEFLQHAVNEKKAACFEECMGKQTLHIHASWVEKMRLAGVTEIIQKFKDKTGFIGDTTISQLNDAAYNNMIKTFFKVNK